MPRGTASSEQECMQWWLSRARCQKAHRTHVLSYCNTKDVACLYDLAAGTRVWHHQQTTARIKSMIGGRWVWTGYVLTIHRWVDQVVGQLLGCPNSIRRARHVESLAHPEMGP